MTGRRVVAAIAGAFLLIAGLAVPLPAQEPSTRFSETISVGYVLIPFVVTDGKGKPVKNLRSKDVTLLVDSIPVKTDMFEQSVDSPVSYTILLDGSGSMGLAGKMDNARLVVHELMNHSIPGDDFALYVFSEGQVNEVVPFTSNPGAVISAMQKVKPWGKTAFYDALAAIPDKTILGRNGSRVIILLTDGLDNASTLSREQLNSLLEGVEVPVYPLGLRSQNDLTAAKRDPETLLHLDILGQIARASGGRLVVADRAEQLRGAIEAMEQDLRMQYLIGFKPTGQGGVKYRRIDLKLSGPVRLVKARAGYRGTDPPRREGPSSAKPLKKGTAG